MTLPRHTTPPSFSQDLTSDVLYEQAIAFVQANQNVSPTDLQRYFQIGYDVALQLHKRLEANGALQKIEACVEPKEVLVRVADLAESPAQALVELIACDVSGNQRLVTTSAPMPQDAAQAIAHLYDKPNAMPPAFQSLRSVLGKTGRTAWASAASSNPHAAELAPLEACASIKDQAINLNVTRSALVITTLTSDCKFVNVIKTVLDTVSSDLQPNAHVAAGVVIDDTISGQVQVQLLITGL